MMYGRSSSGQYVPMGPGMMYNGSKNPAQGQSGNAESSSQWTAVAIRQIIRSASAGAVGRAAPTDVQQLFGLTGFAPAPRAPAQVVSLHRSCWRTLSPQIARLGRAKGAIL
jgi:hypothetical protein